MSLGNFLYHSVTGIGIAIFLMIGYRIVSGDFRSFWWMDWILVYTFVLLRLVCEKFLR